MPAMTDKAVVGIMRVAGPGKPDGADGSVGQGARSSRCARWTPVTLAAIKAEPRLAAMELIRQSRLSVAPVRDEEWRLILEMSGE